MEEEEKEKRKLPSINTLKNRIKKALKNQSSYSEGIEILIEQTAGNLYAYGLALRDVEGLDESFVIEKTREGNEKLAPHPAIGIMRNQSEMIRKQLRELRLTLATVGGIDGDEMDDIINSVDSLK